MEAGPGTVLVQEGGVHLNGIWWLVPKLVFIIIIIVVVVTVRPFVSVAKSQCLHGVLPLEILDCVQGCSVSLKAVLVALTFFFELNLDDTFGAQFLKWLSPWLL